jgi:hypothetical protein
MQRILKESVYLVQLGPQTHVLRIEELAEEGESWGRKYRLQLPAEGGGETKTIYSSSEMEVALCAAEFLIWRGRTNPTSALLE